MNDGDHFNTVCIFPIEDVVRKTADPGVTNPTIDHRIRLWRECDSVQYITDISYKIRAQSRLLLIPVGGRVKLALGCFGKNNSPSHC